MIYNIEAHCRCGWSFTFEWDPDTDPNPKIVECPRCKDRWPITIATTDGTRVLGYPESEIVDRTLRKKDLREAVRAAINRYSAESESDTPDRILAEYLMDCLRAFDKATNARTRWYGDKERS